MDPPERPVPVAELILGEVIVNVEKNIKGVRMNRIFGNPVSTTVPVVLFAQWKVRWTFRCLFLKKISVFWGTLCHYHSKHKLK